MSAEPRGAAGPGVEDPIRAERGKVYGDPLQNHDNIAQAWTAVGRSRFGPSFPELDGQFAALCLAAFKIVRAARPVPEEPKAKADYLDSYPDAKNYMDFAREYVDRERRVTPPPPADDHLWYHTITGWTHDPQHCKKNGGACRAGLGV